MEQYGFFIDLSRCIGCNACVIACKQWHDIEPGPVKWMRVYQWEKGSFPNIDLHVLPIPCFHCAEPVCAESCPNKAIYKDEKFGAVLIDTDKCTGERKCWEACPYGAPQFEGDSLGLKMSKCNMCIDRLEQGLKPICVLSCSMRALEFGPIDELRKKYGRIHGVKEGYSQCRVSCPANMEAGHYIKLIAEGKTKEALNVFRESSPFAGVLGEVCAHPCEVDCLRGQFDNAVSICALKRYMVTNESKTGRDKTTRVGITKKEKIAIVGSGPAGLSCAYDLIKQGYQVSVFEAEFTSGGLLRYGIPEYRLSRDILDDEISYIEELGVEIKTNSRISDIQSLFDQDYKAVFIATGAWQSIKLGVSGEDSPGVLYALDFLKRANSNEKIPLGDKVIVIGGGSVAIDAARVSKRQGAKEVHLVCLESRDFSCKDRMLAQPDEVDEAEKEGIIIHSCLGVLNIVNKSGTVTGLEVIACESVREEDGRFAPVYVEGQTSIIPADNIIVAIGQSIDISSVDKNLKQSSEGRIQIDPVTFETSIPGVFAGGDMIGGVDVISAVATGKAAAISITRYLTGEDLYGRDPIIYSRSPQIQWQRAGFEHKDYSWNEEKAIEQAKRCLNCDITIPSVVFKSVNPKKQIVPWDAGKTLELWQKRQQHAGEPLPDIFSDAYEVMRDSSDIMGRKELILKPETREELMFYTTDDE